MDSNDLSSLGTPGEIRSLSARTMLFARRWLIEASPCTISQKSRSLGIGTGPRSGEIEREAPTYPATLVNGRPFEDSASKRRVIRARTRDSGGEYYMPRGSMPGRADLATVRGW